MYFTYKLIDPRDNMPFYIGTTNDPERRLTEHIACVGKNLLKDDYIRKLQASSLQPELVIIGETEDRGIAKEREEYWIKYYKNLGVYLTNLTSKGIGINEYPLRRKEKKSQIDLEDHEDKWAVRKGARYKEVRSILEYQPKMRTEQEAADLLGISLDELNRLIKIFQINPVPANWSIITPDILYKGINTPLFSQEDIIKLRKILRD